MLDKPNDLVYFLGSRDVVLDPAEHVFIKLRPGVQIIECEYLVSMLKLLSALGFEMVADDDELFALVLAEPAFKHQLLLGLLKSLADACASVDACEVEQLHELVAGFV